jgi:hypothetical protein
MVDPKALDTAFGKVLADVAALIKDGDVIAIDGKALRGARDKDESARTRMMVSAYACRLRLTLATVTTDRGTELDAAIEALGLIALKGKVVTGDALHCNRCTVAAINAGGGDWCLGLQGQSGVPSVRRPRLFRHGAKQRSGGRQHGRRSWPQRDP